jgi:hypothetical protein
MTTHQPASTETPEEIMAEVRSRFWDLATKIGLGATTLLGATLIAHETRIAAIESTRFTDKDWAEQSQRVMSAIETHANAPAHGASGAKIDRLTTQVDRMEAKLDRLLERHLESGGG